MHIPTSIFRVEREDQEAPGRGPTVHNLNESTRVHTGSYSTNRSKP